MKVPRRDLFATSYVAIALLLYLLWIADVDIPVLGTVRAVGIAILVLGFAASATAVVPGFEDLIHGSKMYMAASSIVGVAAFVAGILLLVDPTEAMLGVLMGATVVLWVMATVRHMRARPAGPSERVGRHRLGHAM